MFILDDRIQHLSLRNCMITDIGAEKLGISLGTIKLQNTKLLSLNLSSNAITDAGATELARGLRVNRILLVLNLSGNDIGDVGACRLAETLSRFKMTHEEIVRRRTIKKERFTKEMSPVSRKSRTESDRQSSTALQKSVRMDKLKKVVDSTSTLKDRSKSKDTLGNRDSSNDTKQTTTKSKKEKDSNNSTVSGSNLKKESKSKEAGATLANDKTAKTTKGKNLKGKSKDSDSNEVRERIKRFFLFLSAFSKINALKGQFTLSKRWQRINTQFCITTFFSFSPSFYCFICYCYVSIQ